MKTLMLLSTVLLAAGALAQSSRDDQEVQSETIARTRTAPVLIEMGGADNIVGEKFTLSGVAVQVVNADNPLQLLNPAAPERYGSGERNVVRDPKTGRTSGLKIFSLEF